MNDDRRTPPMSSIRDEIETMARGAVLPPKTIYSRWEFQIDTADKNGRICYGRIVGVADSEANARQFQTDILNSLKTLYFIK